MAIEGQYHRQTFMLPRITNRLPDDLLVAEVDPVEKTYRQAHLPPPGSKLVRAMDGSHAQPARFTSRPV
jgi:hypothetical protein